MLRLIAYDIANERRLSRIAKVCEGFGMRVEYSLFESRLSNADFAEFISRVKKIVQPEDRVIVYPICRSCEEKIVSMGACRGNFAVDSFVF